MPRAVEDCVRSILADWRRNPGSRPAPDEAGQDRESQAYAICWAQYKEAAMPEKLIELAGLLEHSTLVELIEQYAAWLAEQEPGGPATCVCPECGHEQAKARGVPCRAVACPECGAQLVAGVETVDAYVQEAVQDESLRKAVREVGRRHTRREYDIIEEVIRLLYELHGEIDDLEMLLQRAEEADRYVRLREAANVADYLEANIHREFTLRADGLLEKGIISRDERIALSGFIGQALGAFSELMDAEMADLRTRAFAATEWGEPIPAPASGVPESEPEAAPVQEAGRELVELVERSVSAPALSEAGNLSGIVLVEGRSANGNVYTREALTSGIRAFAGRPIYADHPSRSEEADRPERSIRDLVGRLPLDPGDLWVEAIESGPHAGRAALHYRNGQLSETADWLATLIREGIAGDQSINAMGAGYPDANGDFIVESFESAVSLDFVTSAAAGGRATLVEAAPGTSQNDTEEESPEAESWIEELTVERLAESRPDIVDSIAHRERRKAYGEKRELSELMEANRIMSDKLKKAKEAARKAIRDKRKTQAEHIVTEGLSGLPEGVRPQVRRLIESDVQRFVEQVEVPTVELPEDVQALPEDAQADWMAAYMEAVAMGKGDEAAAHAAWTRFYEEWEQGDDGEWSRKGAEEEEPEAALDTEMMPEPMTMEALRTSVGEVVAAFRQALAESAGPGVSDVPTPDPEAGQGADDETRKERYMRAGLTEAEAEIAVRGRQ